jgi:hypothetical protein
MAKQIKLGFDKGATRSVETDQVLQDIRGNVLRDEAGNNLYTKTNIELPGFFYARKATSIVTNNSKGVNVVPGGPIYVEEQFPEQSEVSSSLLGVPRKNVQQSLLADVSVYGLDPNTWEFFRNPSPYAPPEWISRYNNVYGNRFYPRLAEKPDQQALAIEAYPTPWTFPFGPEFGDQSNRYEPTLFPFYVDFIQMGNDLYDYYSRSDIGEPEFAARYFLPPASEGGASVTESSPKDVEYGENLSIAMAHIERWTITWMDIRGGRLRDPREGIVEGKRTLIFDVINERLGTNYTESNTRPGYRSSSYYYAQLQSKEAFRYQPGAISGFTFGVKINFDETSLNNKIEWGCANETDQYMFQVAGSNFNIVRRSTVPFSPEAQIQNNLQVTPQLPTLSPNPFERPGSEALGGQASPLNDLPRYETVISKDDFNGDPLDGSGASGYNISFQEVTMYKIEYSWYGAIGAKFYAYIPVGHGECRWVLLHTLIIENTLTTPSLRNPYMHFRYTMAINETSGLREPIYIYKYGASYYIDGADEGSYTYNTFNSESKPVVSSESRPIIGFQTKDSIVNRDGVATPNQKNVYVDRVTASADRNVRVDFVECEGCQDGFGHFYSTSLVNGSRAQTEEFYLQNGSTVVYANTELSFTTADIGKKIIAPGIFSTYVYPDIEDLSRADIRRRVGIAALNNDPPVNSNFSPSATSTVGGQTINLYDTSENGLLFTGKLVGFDDVAVASIPLTKSNINVRFLNPVLRESTGHFREFRIGVTSKTPSIDEDGNLVFNGNPLNQDNELFVEFAQYQAQKNVKGSEVSEHDPRVGDVMEDDYRIPRPKGADSGNCSTLKIFVNDNKVGATYLSANPITGAPGNFIKFDDGDPGIKVNGGEIGVLDDDGNRYIVAKYNDVNVVFTSDAIIDSISGNEVIYASISDPITINGGKISFKTVKLEGRHVGKSSVQNFNVFPLYVFVSMHDNARVNNIVIKEYDETSMISHSPSWIIGAESNIQDVETGNAPPPSGITDVVGTNEYLGRDGLYYMGGLSTVGNPPASFDDNYYLSATLADPQLSQPLRPGSIKYTFFVGANETVDVSTDHVFGIDRYKITKGTFNNRSVYINSRVLDAGQTGTLSVNVLTKEQ